jgi:hypothetical protein
VTPPDQRLHFVARDFRFEGPTTASAGLTELTLDNAGVEDHQLALFRLNDGVEPGTALGAMSAAGNLEAGRPYGRWVAGPNSVARARGVSVVADLTAGRYIVGCLMPAADGQLHAMKGMLAELEVTEAGQPVRHHVADDDLADASMHDFSFELPADFDGSGTIEIVNEGSFIHEFAVVRLRGDATVDDVAAYEKLPFPRPAPAPSEAVTGTTFVDPGGRARLDLDLAPGRYAVVCYLPGPDGRTHLMSGMIEPFPVAG